MIVSPDKTKCSIERLALENGYLIQNLKSNIHELEKRKEELKKLEAIYNFEIRIRKKRKCYAFEIEIYDNINFEEEDVFYFIKNYIFNKNNKIKIYTKLGNIIYLKLKSDETIGDKEWITPHYKLRQIDPKNIIKKVGNNLNIELNID